VSFVCDVLGIQRSSYYAHQRRPLSVRRQDLELKPLIQRIFWRHRRRYGARRIRIELAARGRRCSVRRIRRLMAEMSLEPIQPRSFRPRTTQSRHQLGYSPNWVLNAPPPNDVDRVWVADITYIPLKTGKFVYLALLMDLFSRRVVGWRLDDHMTESLVLDALRNAIANRQPRPDLIHHSDRGGQYAGRQYRQMLTRSGMQQSMSRQADCYDNAFMESCFGTIKRELEMTPYANMPAALAAVTEFVRYYNIVRRHSSIAYLSPAEFERQHAQRSR
jgi:putative transposase